MRRLLICPHSFEVTLSQVGQNPFIAAEPIDKKSCERNHKLLERSIKNKILFHIHPSEALPDVVFVANGGLSLIGLPEQLVVLPSMKYSQRKKELPYLKSIFSDLGIQTVTFPKTHVFEGQAEAKWFNNGKLLICGYGSGRATKESFIILEDLLNKIYSFYGIEPPKVLALPLKSPYYHLDVAMMEFDNKCIIHKDALSPRSMTLLKNTLGEKNVHVIDTDDKFCLNAFVVGEKLICHKITDSELLHKLETITARKVQMIDTSQFELSGGSVRCMVFDLHHAV